MFLNIPGEIYGMFSDKQVGNINSDSGFANGFSQVQQGGSNIFFNFDTFSITTDNILLFIKVLLVGLAVFMFVLAGILLIAR